MFRCGCALSATVWCRRLANSGCLHTGRRVDLDMFGASVSVTRMVMSAEPRSRTQAEWRGASGHPATSLRLPHLAPRPSIVVGGAGGSLGWAPRCVRVELPPGKVLAAPVEPSLTATAPTSAWTHFGHTTSTTATRPKSQVMDDGPSVHAQLRHLESCNSVGSCA